MDPAVALERCLEPDELLALVEGTCDDDERARALAHAATCEACRLAIAGVARAVRSDLGPDSVAHDDVRVTTSPPTEIGRHRIVRTLGRGGMGVVYEAFDPRLRRRIAIKRMHAGVRELGPRLRREAQVLARLADPNVVAVLEAGPDWIAMELVEGETMASWQRGKPWRAIVSAYLQAARGLAAAHAVGVVHRDFKPHNVLVDRIEQRVRVADFGLAAAELERSEPALTPDDALTTATGMVGTPAYMSPEQFLGRRADAASDQFSFCVALHEALVGERPFAGDDVMALCAAVLAGKRRPRPRNAVPAAIWRVVDRGLETEPRRRWPSMHALASALERAAARRRAPVLVGAGALAVVGALLWVDAAPQTCESDDAMAQVWTPARAQSTRTALLGSGLEYAEATADNVEQLLDAYVAQWTELRTASCHADAVRADALDCLDDRAAALDELLHRFDAGDREVVLAAAPAVRRLPSVHSCEQPRATVERSPAARELSRELVTERVTLPLHMDDTDLPRLELLVARARETGDARLVAEALGLLGSAQAVRAHWDQAMPTLEDAYLRSYELGDDGLASELARDLALGANWQGHSEEALRWARVASAAATDPSQRADVAAVEAEVLMQLERPEEAKAALAVALGEDAPANARVSSLSMLAQIHAMAGELDQAEPPLLAAVALIERDAGPNHPDMARPLNLLGVVQIQRGELHRAVATLEQARDIVAAQLGDDHPMVGHVLGNLALAQGALGDREGAYQSLLRVLQVFEREHGVNHPQIGITLSNLSRQAHDAGRHAEAVLHARRAVEIDRALGLARASMAPLSIEAQAQRDLGDREAARRSFIELLELRRELEPSDTDELGWVELQIAELEHELGDRAAAEQHLRRALEHYAVSTETSPGEQARTQRIAARLRGHDRARAVEHLRKAWALFGEHDPDANHIARDLSRRIELVATWRALGSDAFAPWSTITS